MAFVKSPLRNPVNLSLKLITSLERAVRYQTTLSRVVVISPSQMAIATLFSKIGPVVLASMTLAVVWMETRT